MPPRSGQLDQISEAIGRISGQVEGIEKYVHEWRHGVNNVSQKVDALGVKIAGDIAGLRAEIRADLDSLSVRVAKLEADGIRINTTKNLATWFLQSPLVGWIVAGVLAFAALWKHK